MEEPTFRADDPLIPLIPLDFVLSVDAVGWEPSCQCSAADLGEPGEARLGPNYLLEFAAFRGECTLAALITCQRRFADRPLPFALRLSKVLRLVIRGVASSAC